MSVSINMSAQPFSIVCDANNAMNKNCCKEENKIGIMEFDSEETITTTTNRLVKDDCMVLIDVQGMANVSAGDDAVLPVGFRPSYNQYVYCYDGANPPVPILVSAETGHIVLGETPYVAIYGVISLC